MTAVEVDECRNIDVGNAVAVSQTESLVPHIVAYALQTTASGSVLAGIYQGYAPGLGIAVMDVHAVLCHVKSDV
ncbi:hypothetical protein D3C75_1120670 [compost metagenome]